MAQRNPLSALGRMSYSAQLITYPIAGLFYMYVMKPMYDKSVEDGKKRDEAMYPKARTVDPDLYTPFTPIPFHNNFTLKAAHKDLKMFGYINEHHINPQSYFHKQYFHSFNHEDKDLSHTYNWHSFHGGFNH